MTEEETYYNRVGRKIKGATQGQMFGKPCFKVGKKAFCCFYKNCMVFKLTGEWHQEAMSYDGSELFDPSGKGRAMKEWVQVPYDYKYEWALLAQKSAEYVSG